MARIEPVAAPYALDVAQQLEHMMPAGVPPIGLFRTFVHNLPMARSMGEWGGYELGRKLSLTMRDREIVIDRTCAQCGCEYEWGVHVAFFAERVGLSNEHIRSITHGSGSDPCWHTDRDRCLIEAVDELHHHSTLSDPLWERMRLHFTDQELLDLLMLCGWYHAISFAANGAQVALEVGAPRFADVV